jgi:hypothetical protein
VGLTNAAVIVGFGLEWNSVPSHKFVHPGYTATTNRIQVGEMLLHEGSRGLEAKEGLKFNAETGRQAEGQGPRLLTCAGKTSPFIYHGGLYERSSVAARSPLEMHNWMELWSSNSSRAPKNRTHADLIKVNSGFSHGCSFGQVGLSVHRPMKG